jgi:hypothetical protein
MINKVKYLISSTKLEKGTESETIYSQNSVPRTQMGQILWMARTDLKVPSIFLIFLSKVLLIFLFYFLIHFMCLHLGYTHDQSWKRSNIIHSIIIRYILNHVGHKIQRKHTTILVTLRKLNNFLLLRNRVNFTTYIQSSF